MDSVKCQEEVKPKMLEAVEDQREAIENLSEKIMWLRTRIEAVLNPEIVTDSPPNLKQGTGSSLREYIEVNTCKIRNEIEILIETMSRLDI